MFFWQFWNYEDRVRFSLHRRRAQKGRVFFILQSKIGTDSFDGKAQFCGEEYKSSILSDEPHSMESTRRKTAARDSYTIDQSRHLLYFLPGVSMWCIFWRVSRWKRQKITDLPDNWWMMLSLCQTGESSFLFLWYFSTATQFVLLSMPKEAFQELWSLFISVQGTKGFKCTRTEEGFPFIFLHILSLWIDLISRAPANPITLKTDDDIGLREASTSFQISNFRSTLSLRGLDFWGNQSGGRLLFYILA